MKQVDLAAAARLSLQAIKNFERGATDARGTTFQRIERAACIAVPALPEKPSSPQKLPLL
jgi:hypothetical protein